MIPSLLQKNKKITKLQLQNCQIIESEILSDDFYDAINQNTSLTHLDISGRERRSWTFARKLIEKIKFNTSLIHLVLCKYDWDDSVADFLSKNLELKNFKMNRYQNIKEVKTFDLKFNFYE